MAERHKSDLENDMTIDKEIIYILNHINEVDVFEGKRLDLTELNTYTIDDEDVKEIDDGTLIDFVGLSVKTVEVLHHPVKKAFGFVFENKLFLRIE